MTKRKEMKYANMLTSVVKKYAGYETKRFIKFSN